MTVADEDMPDLPPLNVVVTPVTLPDEVMVAYATMQEELFAAIDERGIEAVSPLVATGKCAQMANGFLYDEGNEDPVPVHTVKIDWLRELVESLEGEPLLIAYEFVEDLRAIRRAFGEVPALGGPTPAREAKRLIEAWNAGTLPLLAFHPASAGHGINLQFGGSRMAWLSPSWSAELTEQAIARIYRPGQTQRVTIHVCVAAGTVDEMKRDRVHREDERAGGVQTPPGAGLMHERTAFRLAMLANGYWPLLNECKKAIEPGWPKRRPDEAEILSWDRSALLSTGSEARRRPRGDRRRRERAGSHRGAGERHRPATSPSSSSTASCATPAGARRPGSRASTSPSGGSPRAAGTAAAIRTIRRCRSISSSASARSGRGNSRSTGRMRATAAAR